MLKLSKLADYATVLMVYLAQHPGGYHSAKTIAQASHLSLPTVSKLLKLLTRAGLLASLRGNAGGYCLAKLADSISVASIIDAVEGPPGITECSSAHSECYLQPICHVQANWQVINKAIRMALESVSLKMLAKPKLSIEKIDLSQIHQLKDEVE